MKVTEGKIAKDFINKDIYDNQITLKEFQGKKILLSFFRNVVCPFCNFRVYQLSKFAEKWQEELNMIFVFESPKKNILKSSFHADIQGITLIADPEKELYNLYGVETSFFKVLGSVFTGKNLRKQYKLVKDLGIQPKVKENSSKIIPADFLIDEDFRIVAAHYGKSINDHLDIQVIENFAKNSLV